MNQEMSKVKSYLSAFTHYGFAKLEKPVSFHIYRQWLQKGYHGSMNYLVQHADLKEDTRRWVPRARSAIVVAQNYLPHPEAHPSLFQSTRKALYARGKDYHHWFRSHLNQACQFLKTHFPKEEFLGFTDSSPILERDLAYRAGLGWVGKNTCLIHKQHGSLFFIGEIYTSLKLEAFTPLHLDHCGNCTRCMEACPTQAITKERELDARKCISYLTIESRNMKPQPIYKKISDWFFGCDICQTVCPWNEKVFGEVLKPEQVSQQKMTDELVEDLRWILSSSNKSLQKKIKGTPLSRAGALGLKRNAILIITNMKIHCLAREVLNYTKHKTLGTLARSCIQELKIQMEVSLR